VELGGPDMPLLTELGHLFWMRVLQINAPLELGKPSEHEMRPDESSFRIYHHWLSQAGSNPVKVTGDE
jgi:hypothetical protein